MKTIPNYEVALAHLADDQGQPAPVVALNFGWDGDLIAHIGFQVNTQAT